MEEGLDPYRGAVELWMDCEGGYCCAQAQAVMDTLVSQRDEVEAHRDQLIVDGLAALEEWTATSRAFDTAFREIEEQAASMNLSVQVLQDDRERLERAVLVLGEIVEQTAKQWADVDTELVGEAMGTFLRVKADS